MIDNRTPIEKHIDGILDNFNFEKCHAVMRFLNWTLATCDPNDGSEGYPSVKHMRGIACDLMKRAYAKMKDPNDWTAFSTAGFHAMCYMHDGEYKFDLSFRIENADNE